MSKGAATSHGDSPSIPVENEKPNGATTDHCPVGDNDLAKLLELEGVSMK
jgi:hypothetical protein